SIGIGVFEDLDTVSPSFAFLCAARIFVEFQDPQPPALVPRHRDWIYDLRFGSEKPDFKPIRHGKFLLRLFRRKRWSRRWRMGAADLAARWLVRVDRKAKVPLWRRIIGRQGRASKQRADNESG